MLNGDGKEQLRYHFDEDCLLPEHGGTSDFKFEYNPDESEDEDETPHEKELTSDAKNNKSEQEDA